MRDRLDLATKLFRHGARVVAEALVEHLLEPLPSVGTGNSRSIQAPRSKTSAPAVAASGVMSSAAHADHVRRVELGYRR